MNLLHHFQQSSLRARVLVVFTTLLLTAFVALGALAVKFTRDQINQGLESSADREAAELANFLTEPAAIGDTLSIEQRLHQRAGKPGLTWLDFNGSGYPRIHIAGQTAKKTRPDWFARWLSLKPPIASQAITAGKEDYGQISLQLDTTGDENQVWLIISRSLAAYAFMLALTAWIVARMLSANLKGLSALREMTRQFEEGDYDARVRVSPYSPPEILETAAAFNHTADRIASLLDEMRLMAYHDSLTGLPNRRALEDRLRRALRLAREEQSRHAFCYIDLDQFKLINDTCGHAAGDLLLSQLPLVLKPALPSDAYLGRLGGDEFGLLLFNKSPQHAQVIAALLIEAIHDFSFSYRDATYRIGASVGIAAITDQSRDEGEVLIQADLACYSAKQAGRNRSHIYETGQQKLQEEMDWANWFYKAVAENRLVLFRQRIDPLCDHNHPSHYEVLLRIRRSSGALESPVEFLAAAERFGLAPTLDRWVIRTLCRWMVAHPRDLSGYSINLSGHSLNDEYFLDFVLEVLDNHKIFSERLAFEITETAAVHNLENAQHFIEKLKTRGCAFYLDDFGKGMASFSYLKQLPADYLKIDGSFVREMLRDPTDFAIVNAFNQIAHDLSRKSVAECVENDYLLEKLREIGVDYVQGYAVHIPEPFPGQPE